MKITELKNTESTPQEPSQVVMRFLKNPEYVEFLKEFDFDSPTEIAEGFKYVAMAVYFDEFCRTKHNRDKLPAVALIYKQMSALVTGQNPSERYRATSEALWSEHFERIKMERNFNEFFKGKKSPEKYMNAVEKMREWWQWSDKDIEALRYMVCQSVAGHAFPSKLQRAMYIWSEEQMTGKTTVSEMIVSCLNGERSTENIEAYKSDVPHEWQFERFAVPESLNKRAILLDEAFSGKSGTENYYPRIKSELTATSCKYEVKGGGFFNAKCFRNYFITSNYPPDKFIQDKKERRFFVINMKTRPPVLTDDEIYTVISDFVRNAKPEKDLAQWYMDTMPNVTGNAGKREIEFANAYLSGDFLKLLESFAHSMPPKRVIYFPSEFKRWIFNEAGIPKTDKNAEIVNPAVYSIFGKPKELKGGQRYYNVNRLIEIIKDKQEGDEEITEKEDNLPF